MTRTVSWPDEYEALIERLPDLVDASRLTMGGFSACVDVYLSFARPASRSTPRDATAPGRGHARRTGAARGERNRRRTLRRLAGRPGWIDRHVTGRTASAAPASRRPTCSPCSARRRWWRSRIGAPASSLFFIPIRLWRQRAASRRSRSVGARRRRAPAALHLRVHRRRDDRRRPGCRARREPSSASTTASCSAIAAFVRASSGECRPTPAPASSAASTRCRRSAPRPSSTMPPVSPLPGGEPACRSSIWNLATFRPPRFADLTIARLLPAVTSVGMSLSELADLTGERAAGVGAPSASPRRMASTGSASTPTNGPSP